MPRRERTRLKRSFGAEILAQTKGLSTPIAAWSVGLAACGIDEAVQIALVVERHVLIAGAKCTTHRDARGHLHHGLEGPTAALLCEFENRAIGVTVGAAAAVGRPTDIACLVSDQNTAEYSAIAIAVECLDGRSVVGFARWRQHEDLPTAVLAEGGSTNTDPSEFAKVAMRGSPETGA